MKSIAEFFSKIQSKQAQKILIYTIAKEAIFSISKIDIPIGSITFSGKNIILSGLDQTSKSVIFIKKTAIIGEMNKKLPNMAVVDIRA
ncbi:MAG: hypothetical protein WCV82_03410 [Candidatus Paceibacterota bacterium]